MAKRLEIKIFVDIDETQTDSDEVLFHLETAIDETINGVVKRVDLIDETEVA